MFLGIIQEHAPIVELGGGDGLWLAAMLDVGIDVISYDAKPRGPGVRLGRMFEANRHTERTLLMIWPPDRSDWLSEWNGKKAISIGAPYRFTADWPVIEQHDLPHGPKGENVLRVHVRP